MVLVRSGFRMLTQADLVENATELSAVHAAHEPARDRARRAAPRRDRLRQERVRRRGLPGPDRDRCATRSSRPTRRSRSAALERGKQRLSQHAGGRVRGGDPDEATRRATAVAGHHIADRTCVPATDSITGDATGKGWIRAAATTTRASSSRRSGSSTSTTASRKGQVAIYFFPMGSSEKAVVELTDGSEYVHGPRLRADRSGRAQATAR